MTVPAYPPPALLCFATRDPEASRKAIQEMKRDYNIVLTDGWNGG